MFKVRACSLRLTNVYGPRQLIRHDRQGFIGWFIRLAIEGGVIQIYGDGTQKRDFVYVDDAADAFLRAGALDACNGEVFNVGGDQPISHAALTSLILEIAGSGRVEFSRLAGREEGDRHRRLLCRFDQAADARLAGTPTTALADGLRETIAYCRQHFHRYVRSRARGGARVSGVAAAVPVGGAARGRRRCPRRDRAWSCRGWFILGPEVDAFEREFAAAAGARHAVGVGTGTDAIALALRALGVGPGDEVITTPLSAAYTALAIVMAGAEPVFADIDAVAVDDRSAAIEAAITPRTRAIVPVHLYGQPADMAAIERIAAAHALPIVEDCCQAHLATAPGDRSAPSGPPGRSASTRRRTSPRSVMAAPW